MRVNISFGNSPTSSANMQKTSRLTKCATSCGSFPRARSACASVANALAARSVNACRLSPGRSRSGSDIAHFNLSRTAPSARSSNLNSLDLAHAVRPVRMNAEARHVRHDQQRRVLQRQRILP